MKHLHVLVSGWFSFEHMGATAGDLIARDLLCEYLNNSGIPYDIAVAQPFTGGLDWRQASPEDYSHVVFVCGPLGNGWPVAEFLNYFSGCRLIGLNLSMLDEIEKWNPFEILYERDSNLISRPDISIAATAERVPLTGRILAHLQKEYGRRSRHPEAHAAIDRLLQKRETAIVPIDTVLVDNPFGLRTPREIESLIAGMDLVVTTRLHGMVLAIKNGVPALAIDPIDGGAKISQQAKALGWPVVFGIGTLDDAQLLDAFDYCSTNEARKAAQSCADRAAGHIEQMLRELMERMKQ